MRYPWAIIVRPPQGGWGRLCLGVHRGRFSSAGPVSNVRLLRCARAALAISPVGRQGSVRLGFSFGLAGPVMDLVFQGKQLWWWQGPSPRLPEPVLVLPEGARV